MATFRRRIADVRILLPEHARVLDVGCATGYFLEAAKESGLRPYGVELSAYGADACRQKVDPGHVYQGTLEDSRFDIPSEPGFDAIFMSDLLEHVRNPCTTLAAARSSLKPSGLLVITTPWTESFSHRAMGRHWLHYKPEHLYYFGIKSLGRMLQASGFDIIRVNSARKCLSLEYARNQFAAGGYQMRFLARLLNRFPTSLLNRHLWVRIGEATIVARPHEELTHAATRH